MGIPDNSLLYLIEKVRSWVSWGGSDFLCLPDKFDMLKMCSECNRNINEMSQHNYNCKSCGRRLCGKCIRGFGLPNLESGNNGFRETISSCKFCSDVNREYKGLRKYSETVHPSASPQESPRQSPEPPSPCFSVESERISSPMNSELNQGNHFEIYLQDLNYGYYPHSIINTRMTSSGAQLSQLSTHSSTLRSDEEGTEDSGKHFLSPSRTYCHIDSDMDSSSVRARHETYNYKSVGSSPSESPSSRVELPVHQGQDRSPISQYDGPFGQQTMAVLRKPEQGTEDAYTTVYFSDDLSIFRNQNENSQRLYHWILHGNFTETVGF